MFVLIVVGEIAYGIGLGWVSTCSLCLERYPAVRPV
jgi:hypothetical protein